MTPVDKAGVAPHLRALIFGDDPCLAATSAAPPASWP